MSVSFNPSFSTDDVCVGQDTSLCLTDDLTSIKTSLAGKISEDDAVTSFASINHTHTGYADEGHTHTVADIGDLTATASELNYMDGVTSNVQTQLNGKATSDHTHTIINITGLQDALDGKAASSHTHSGYAVSNHSHTPSSIGAAEESHTHTPASIGAAEESHTHTPASIGAAASSHTHAIINVTGLQDALDGKSASNHTHTISNVTGLQDELDGKAESSHAHAIANVTGLQSALNGKASTDHTHTGYAVTGHNHTLSSLGAAASSHTHTVSNISDLTATASELNYMDGVTSNVQTQLNGKAASSHTHTIANVTGLQDALDGKADYDHMHDEYAYSDHTHSYLPLSGGTVTGETNFSGGLVRLKGVQTLFHSGSQLVFGSNSIPTRIAGSAISATKSITVDSDERLKENIEPANIDECKQFINCLNVKTFNYIGDDAPCIGVIAQEVNDLDMADKFVVQGPDGCYSVKATDLVFPLIAAVQKLSQEVEILKNR